MPIYEYQCEDCGHKLEKLQKLSDALLKVCPSCSQASLNKLVSAAAFRLKGGGWYETDFKTGKKKNVSESENGPPSSSSVSGNKESGDKASGSEGSGSESSGSEGSGSKSSDSKTGSGSSSGNSDSGGSGSSDSSPGGSSASAAAS